MNLNLKERFKNNFKSSIWYRKIPTWISWSTVGLVHTEKVVDQQFIKKVGNQVFRSRNQKRTIPRDSPDQELSFETVYATKCYFWGFLLRYPFLPEIWTKMESISKYIYGFLIKQHRQGTPLCTDILGKEQLKISRFGFFFWNFWSRFFMEWKLAIILALLFFKGSEKGIWRF